MKKALNFFRFVPLGALARRWYLAFVIAWPVVFFFSKISEAKQIRAQHALHLQDITLDPYVQQALRDDRTSLGWEMVLWAVAIVATIVVWAALAWLLDGHKRRRKNAPAKPQDVKSSKELYRMLTDLEAATERHRQATARVELEQRFGHLAIGCGCPSGPADPAPWSVLFRQDEPYAIAVPLSYMEDQRKAKGFSLSRLKAELHAADAPHVWRAWTTGDDGMLVDPAEGTVSFRVPPKKRNKTP